MDHLELPLHPAFPLFEVPFLCNNVVYTPPFATFAERSGWTWEQLVTQDHCSRPRAAIDAFLQAWLFFGLLKTVFGPGFQPKEFMRRDDGGQVLITTWKLPRLWTEFAANSKSFTADGLLSHRRDAGTNINIAMRLLSDQLSHAQGLTQAQGSTTTQTIVTLSIQLLCRFLAFRLRLDDSFHMHFGVEHGFIESIMLREGWCPFNVERLSHKLNPENLYMVRHMKPPESPSHHNDCTKAACRAYNILPEAYKTHHIGHTDCLFNAANQTLMYSILKADKLPLIANRIYEGSEGVEILPSDSVSKYVAISHVWSHGLGNNEQNSLPSCQLRRLGNLVDALYSPHETNVPYWIDTIPCPLSPNDATDLAIDKMRRTYMEADKVLVVDASTALHNAQGMSVVEKLLRILLSSWTQRLWTLQEGALAKKLYYQFADGAYDVDEMLDDLADLDTYEEHTDIWFSFFVLRDAWGRGTSLPRAQLIYLLARATRYRSTSVAADEALCLSTLAGLDMDQVALGPVEDRMKIFWSQISKPSPLPIFWTGPRLTHPGFRWAPATLLGQATEAFDLHIQDLESTLTEAESEINPQGLQIRAPGILLGSWVASLDATFWVVDQSKKWYFVDLRLSLRTTGNLQHFTPIAPTSSTKQNEDRQLAMILMPSVDNDVGGMEDHGFHKRPWRNRMGLLVTVDNARILSTATDQPLKAGIICNALTVPASENGLDNDPILLAAQALARGNLLQPEPGAKDRYDSSGVTSELSDSFQDHALSNLGAAREESKESCEEIECNQVILRGNHDESKVGRNDSRLGMCLYQGNHAIFKGVALPHRQKWIID